MGAKTLFMSPLRHGRTRHAISFLKASFCFRTLSRNAKVAKVDNGLLMLDTSRHSFQRLQPGEIVYSTGSGQRQKPIGVVLFSAFGFYFAGLLPEVNETILENFYVHLSDELRVNPPTIRSKEIEIFDLISRDGQYVVFRSHPKDIERQRISKSWHTGIIAVDTLAPIGIGQSMLFINDREKREAKPFIYEVAQGISKNSYNADFSEVYIVTNDNSLNFDGFLQPLGQKCNFLVPPKDLFDPDVGLTISAYIGCTIAEIPRYSGRHSILLLPHMEALHNVWKRAIALYIDYSLQASAKFHVPNVGFDRSELRIFYSSLIQRAAFMNRSFGKGSLTILEAINLRENERLEHSSKYSELSLCIEDFTKNDKKYGSKDVERLKVLLNRGISLTPSVLDKLNIPQPNTCKEENERPDMVINSRTLKQHCEELKSISDGNILVQPPYDDRSGLDSDIWHLWKALPLDPRDSFTRIGVGRNANDVLDIRPKNLRKAVGALRLNLLNKLDSNPVKDLQVCANERSRIAAWLVILRHEGFMSLEMQIIYAIAISHGLFDDPKTHGLLENGESSSFAQIARKQIPSELLNCLSSGKVDFMKIKDDLQKIISKLV